ncbi:Serine/threonine-protein kinase Nek3 [Diplonema papillatum]|nr:Serine/threonine-protein kinase Nek3 [Diplonema papillatum]
MDKYERVAKLGEGGQGKVYKVRSKTSGRELVCKMILCVDQETVELATKEAEVMGWLKHSNIIQYEGTFLHQGKAGLYLCLIMEYCSRGDLHTKMREYKHNKEQFKEKQAIRYLRQVLTALEFMHKSGFCHRDVKAANILFDANGTVKVGDFGLSTLMSPMGQQTVVGTPFYFAPEIMLQRKYTTKVDIWNLGVVFLELCTLRQRPANVEVLHSETSVLEDIQKEVLKHGYSRLLASLITQMLRRRPQDRPSASDLLAQVSQIWGDDEVPPSPPVKLSSSTLPQQQPRYATPTRQGQQLASPAHGNRQAPQFTNATRNATPPRRTATPPRKRSDSLGQQQQLQHQQQQHRELQTQATPQGTIRQQLQQQETERAAAALGMLSNSRNVQRGHAHRDDNHPTHNPVQSLPHGPITPRIQSPPNGAQSWTPPTPSQGSRSNYASSNSNGLSGSSISSNPTYVHTSGITNNAALASPRGNSGMGRPPVPTPQLGMPQHTGRSPSPARGFTNNDASPRLDALPSPRGPVSGINNSTGSSTGSVHPSQGRSEEAYQTVVQKLLSLTFTDVRTKARLLACHSRPEVVTLCSSVNDDSLLAQALEQWLSLKVIDSTST